MAASQGARILAITHGPVGAKLEGILRDLGLNGAIIDGDRHRSRPDHPQPLGMDLNGREQRLSLHRAFDALLEIESRDRSSQP